LDASGDGATMAWIVERLRGRIASFMAASADTAMHRCKARSIRETSGGVP
jgi:hypothetical protein